MNVIDEHGNDSELVHIQSFIKLQRNGQNALESLNMPIQIPICIWKGTSHPYIQYIVTCLTYYNYLS